MAYNDFFGEIDRCLGVAPVGVIRVLAAAGATPNPLFAIGGIQVSITIFDVMVIPTAASGGGTLTVETDIAGAGVVALTNAMACAVIGTVARTALIDHTTTGQDVVGPLDAVQATKNAAADEGLVHLIFHLT